MRSSRCSQPPLAEEASGAPGRPGPEARFPPGSSWQGRLRQHNKLPPRHDLLLHGAEPQMGLLSAAWRQSHPPHSLQLCPCWASCSGLCNCLCSFPGHAGGLLQRRSPLLPRVLHLRPCATLLCQGLCGHPLVHQGGGHHRDTQCHGRQMRQQDQLRFRNNLLSTADGPVGMLPPCEGLLSCRCCVSSHFYFISSVQGFMNGKLSLLFYLDEIILTIVELTN